MNRLLGGRILTLPRITFNLTATAKLDFAMQNAQFESNSSKGVKMLKFARAACILGHAASSQNALCVLQCGTAGLAHLLVP